MVGWDQFRHWEWMCRRWEHRVCLWWTLCNPLLQWEVPLQPTLPRQRCRSHAVTDELWIVSDQNQPTGRPSCSPWIAQVAQDACGPPMKSCGPTMIGIAMCALKKMSRHVRKYVLWKASGRRIVCQSAQERYQTQISGLLDDARIGHQKCVFFLPMLPWMWWLLRIGMLPQIESFFFQVSPTFNNITYTKGCECHVVRTYKSL